jgi:hypothetical protein
LFGRFGRAFGVRFGLDARGLGGGDAFRLGFGDGAGGLLREYS